MIAVVSALDRIRKDRVGRYTAAISFVVLFLIYAAVLPASLTGGYVGWTSLQFLTLGLFGTAAALAAFLSLTVAMMVLLVRDGRRASKSFAAGGALLALVTPLLCCSPLLPLGLGLFATIFPALLGAAPGRVQGFIATHETAILAAALAFSALAFWQNAGRIVRPPACRAPAVKGSRVAGDSKR